MERPFTLNGFARWLLDESTRFGTTVWLPVETKGARLLDATLKLARTELGIPLNEKVIYRHALDFIDKSQLEDERISVVDDSTRTGGALLHCMESLAEARPDPLPTQYLACFATEPAISNHRLRRLGTQFYFRTYDEDTYERHLYEMARSILAFGETPEVDHIVIEAGGLSGPIGRTIWAIAESAREQLAVDKDDGIDIRLHSDPSGTFSMTLDLTATPEKLDLARSGTIQAEGIIKLRIFGEESTKILRIVPMAFPKVVQLADHDLATLDDARRIFYDWSRNRWSTPGDMLLSAAQSHVDGKRALFKAVQLTLETQLLDIALSAFRHADIQIHARPTASLERLFGGHLGTNLNSILIGRMSSKESSKKLRARGPKSRKQVEPVGRFPTSVFSEQSVKDANKLINHLRAIFDQENDGLGREHRERVGETYSRFKSEVFHGPTRARQHEISEALDFALGMLSVSPFTSEGRDSEDRPVVQRYYRATEVSATQQQARDYAGQAIGLIAHMLQRFSGYWTSGVDIATMNRIGAILEHVLQRQGLHLAAWEGPDGPSVRFEFRGATPFNDDNFLRQENLYFRTRDGVISPSDEFLKRYDSETLDIGRGFENAAIEIEAALIGLLRILSELQRDPNGSDTSSDVADLLSAWALLARGSGGYNYVASAVEYAIRDLKEPLDVVLRGDMLSHRKLIAPVQLAKSRMEHSRLTTLELLANTDEWVNRLKVESLLVVERALVTQLTSARPSAEYMDVLDSVTYLIDQLADSIGSLSVLRSTSDPSLLDDVDEPLNPSDVVRLIERGAYVLLTGAPGRRPNGMDSELTELDLIARRARLALAEILVIVECLAARRRPADEILSPVVRRPTIPMQPMAILAADIRGSTTLPKEDSQSAALLMRSATTGFGGVQLRDPEGDDMLVAFKNVGSALICASLLQQQVKNTAAFLNHDQRGIRVLVDYGDIEIRLNGNTHSSAANRAYNICNKESKFKQSASDDHLYLTEYAIAACPPTLARSHRPQAAVDAYDLVLSRQDRDGLDVSLSAYSVSDILSRYSNQLRGVAVSGGRERGRKEKTA